MTSRATAALLGALALALAGAGCGGGDDQSSPKAGAGSPATPPATVPASDASVIKRWSDLLRGGDLDSASALFAVPSTVQNGTGPIRLASRPDVVGFNDSLPCGARLLYTTRREPYTVGTFELTGRPGGDCGPGTGEKAATAFRIERGRIVEWLRVAVPPAQPPPPPKPKRPPSDRVPREPTV